MTTDQTLIKPTPTAHARVLGSVAHRQRFQFLKALSDGEVTVDEVVRAACADGGAYLRKIRLHRLLATQPGWSDKRAAEAVRRVVVAAATPTTKTPSGPDIAWLVDLRAGGHRLEAWANTVTDVGQTPWPGFPLSPQPDFMAEGSK